MRERLMVSGAAAVITTTSASTTSSWPTTLIEPLAPAATTCCRSISCERAIPEWPSTRPTSNGSGRTSRLKATDEPTPPPPPTIAILMAIAQESPRNLTGSYNRGSRH